MEKASLETELAIWAPAKNPWRRYAARIIDQYTFGETILGIFGFAVGLFGPNWLFYWIVEDSRWKRMLVMTPLMWLVATPVIAALVAWKGATLGKWLFGLRVVGEEEISFVKAFRREWIMLIWGVGFAFPLLSLIMILRSFGEVEQHCTMG
jgi:uncharacterized RDD family membrane protein YckC